MAHSIFPSTESPIAGAGGKIQVPWYRLLVTMSEDIRRGLPGEMTVYGGAAPPDHSLACDGSAVSRTTYNHLFEVIGTTFGPGDGSTTFDIPNIPDAVAGAFWVIWY